MVRARAQWARPLAAANALFCAISSVHVTHQLGPCVQSPAAWGPPKAGGVASDARGGRLSVRLRGGVAREQTTERSNPFKGSGGEDESSEEDPQNCGAGAALLQDVPERIDFARMEEQILDYWDEVGALEQSEVLARAENRPPFIFFDGPPFATGLPHYGHILAGTIKDVVTRFWAQNGRLVERKWGWDCHGLPIEYEIEQALGIKSRDDVLAMGIPAFNAECRRVVMRYAGEWKRVVRRLARWIDMDKGYKTLDMPYMESVWWTCQQLYKKKLLYRGFKVMPYSTGCKTALSNFEANLNYKDVSDPAIIVRFPLLDDPDLNLLVWTTTPWSMPTNLAVCVNADAEYVEARDTKSGARFVVMRQRLVQVYAKHVDKSCEILKNFSGAALVGRRYSPPFDFFSEYVAKGGFRVVADAYVSADSGTGLVHLAPGFGEDDLRVCLREGIVEKLHHEAAFCAVDGEGCFTSRVPVLQGVRVKDADSTVIALLKDAGRLEQHGSLVHSYPFCYRSETPLIYKAVPSWFVNVESIQERLVAHNEATRWVPAFVKEKRFHNWLTGARDWAISRDRYWGTPIPIWHSPDWEEVVCVGSIEELAQLSGVRVSDLHREAIDHIVIPSQRPGGAPLKRVEEVFDCWFESGAMPMAQHHYPFQNSDAEHQGLLQADFIAEGLDQTRGWFYTLMVLSTALFDRPAFKNVIVNGLVLAADGKKMSKRLRNYPDPETVINATGADALRLYLVSSPVVRAEPLRFKEEDVRGVVRDVMLPWYNAYRFLVQCVHRLAAAEPQTLPAALPLGQWVSSENIMDEWIQGRAATLVRKVRQEMEAYRLYAVPPLILTFLDDLTNWYVRMNRPRFKGAHGPQEAELALSVLLQVLMTMTLVMAPLAPLTSEHMYLNLRPILPAAERRPSIHLLPFPACVADGKGDGGDTGDTLAERVAWMQRVIVAGRTARDRRQLSLKIPAKSATVLVSSNLQVQGLEMLSAYVKAELNLRQLHVQTADRNDTKLECTPDARMLGKRLGAKYKAVAAAIKTLPSLVVRQLRDQGQMSVAGEVVQADEVYIARKFVGSQDSLEAVAVEDMDGALLLMDMEVDEEALMLSAARDLVNRVQKLKKKAGVSPSDSLVLAYQVVGGSPEDTQAVRALTASHASSICSALRFPLQELPSLHALYSADLEKDHANHDAPADSAACESEGQIAANGTNGTNASPGHAQHGVPGGLKMKRIRSIQDLCRDAGSDGVVVVDAIDEVTIGSLVVSLRLRIAKLHAIAHAAQTTCASAAGRAQE